MSTKNLMYNRNNKAICLLPRHEIILHGSSAICVYVQYKYVHIYKP